MILIQGESQMLTVELKKNNVLADLSVLASIKNIVTKLSVKTDNGGETEVQRYSLNAVPGQAYGVLTVGGVAGTIVVEAEPFQTKNFPTGTLIAYTEVTKTNLAYDLTNETKEQYASTIGRVNAAIAVI